MVGEVSFAAEAGGEVAVDGGWLARIEALPGFVPFVRTPVGLAA